MRLFHGGERRCQLYCRVDKCGKLYSSADSYRKHVMREHNFEFSKPDQPCSHTNYSEQNTQIIT